jgi:hypothetical protein
VCFEAQEVPCPHPAFHQGSLLCSFSKISETSGRNLALSCHLVSCGHVTSLYLCSEELTVSKGQSTAREEEDLGAMQTNEGNTIRHLPTEVGESLHKAQSQHRAVSSELVRPRAGVR